MTNFFKSLSGIEETIQNKDKVVSKLLNGLFLEKKISIESISELEYLWNLHPKNITARQDFVYSFSSELKDWARISYSKDIKNVAAKIFLKHFENSTLPDDVEAEIICKLYLNKNINFIDEIKRVSKLKNSSEAKKKWAEYGLSNSKDPNFYLSELAKVKKEKGYLEKKYFIIKNAVKNEALSEDLNWKITNSLNTRKAMDLCWAIKMMVDKRLGSRKTKHYYNLKYKYKKEYKPEDIILDIESRLCVLLVQKRGPKVCDIVTSFLPEKFCIWIYPFATSKKSINNLKRRSIILP